VALTTHPHLAPGLKATDSHKVPKYLSDNPEQFKSAQKIYLHAHFFYSIDKYFNVNRK
jgi:hypothetical protein